MIINANTKIGAILKEAPGALDVIIEINSKFEKLRNPILRKLMAGRTTLAEASKFGGCEIEDFYKKLEPLGFQIDRTFKSQAAENRKAPGFMNSLSSGQLLELDVRPILATGKDPLNIIMNKIKSVDPGGVLKVINSFEPTPLIHLLEKKGFETYVENKGPDHIETYFHKRGKSEVSVAHVSQNDDLGWEEVLTKYGDNIQIIDVRELGMPQPMMAILDALDHLAKDTILFVNHKRIPVFLLPELKQRGFEYRIREINDNEVQLLIFKD
ncbi:MAG TPA: DUF2249 domain-containing protein [Flavisolibacter sp.]|nr:DUF2249 domain-containing protein [Flavisolibacter sp.]